MITPDNLIDAMLGNRFWIWEGDKKAVVYESCPEEGPNVRKKLETFESRNDAQKFLELYRKAYKDYLLTILEVKALPCSSESSLDTSCRKKGKKAPFMSTTKSFQPKTKRKRKKRSDDTSTPTSPATSTPESPTSVECVGSTSPES